MSYLYTPPTWRHMFKLEGALVAGITTSTCVYRQGGVWHQVIGPGMDVFDVPIDTDGTGLVLLFTRPTVVPDSLYTELSANGITPADASWTPGTLTPM